MKVFRVNEATMMTGATTIVEAAIRTRHSANAREFW
jgi:hypothetical protein